MGFVILRVWVLVFGFWFLGFEFWVLGFRFWVGPDSGLDSLIRAEFAEKRKGRWHRALGALVNFHMRFWGSWC